MTPVCVLYQFSVANFIVFKIQEVNG